MPRPIPQGRDRLGILGAPIGAAVLISDTDAEYAIGTNDFIVEFTVTIDDYLTNGRTPRLTGGAAAMEVGFSGGDQIMLVLDGVAYLAGATTLPVGRPVHYMLFADRSGDVYYYMDGVLIDNTDISAKVAVDVDSTVMAVEAKSAGTHYLNRVLMCLREFVLSGAFPTSGEMAAIAMERFLNPDAESPTMALRGAYATERRLDVDFVDVDQDGTVCDNHGTGGDLTIGGGLNWYAVRTQAERTAITAPDESWLSHDQTHRSTGAADIGCALGSYIAETIYKDLIYPGASNTLVKFQNAAGTERVEINLGEPGDYQMRIRSNAVYAILRLTGSAGYSEFGRHGLHVVHHVYDADANLFTAFVNGQWIGDVAVATDLDLSGVLTIWMGQSAGVDGILAMRLWNYAGAAVAPPAGYEEEILRRVQNPWSPASAVFTDAALKANYECRMDVAIAQPAHGTLIKNQPNPGVGDLTISGADTLATATVLKVGGAP